MDAITPPLQPLSRGRTICLAILIAFACFRLAHIHLLWADEDYHIAAAVQILHGKVPYRDFWYDKPPLDAVYYLLIGAYSGWPLRLLDAAYILIACFLAYRLARVWWGEQEGWAAALLLAFFTTFYLPSAVIPFAADALMLVPHLAAIYFAHRRKPIWSGAWAGIAFLINIKAAFVLAVCGLWLWPELLALALGFGIPLICSVLVASVLGAWPGYVEQVWRWGLVYAAEPPVTQPLLLGIRRTADWLGFHAALVVGATCAMIRSTQQDLWRLLSWIVLSFAAVSLGWRFAPHYYLQLLPPLVIAASRGLVLAWRNKSRIPVFACLLLLIPLIRFGPRYFKLGWDDLLNRPPNWSDVVLDLDSQEASQRIRAMAHPGETLFVWGYRPDDYVYTRMVSDSLFWDSQPLTGVPADRHLYATSAIYGGPAAANRQKFIRSKPDWFVDGLGLLNPKLSPAVYPEIRSWLENYKLVARTKMSLIYRRR